MRYFIVIASVICLFTACNNNRTTDRNDSIYVSENETADGIDYDSNTRSIADSIGYYGVYQGMIPDATSRTVKAKLTLYDNNRYIIHSVDIDNDTRTAEEQGTYLIFGDLLTLTPDHNGAEQYYKMNDDHLLPLDDQKNEIEGIHSQNLRLIKLPH